MHESVDNSIGVITALNPYIGYTAAAHIAKLALATGRPIPKLVVEAKLLSHDEVTELLKPESFVVAKYLAPTAPHEEADSAAKRIRPSRCVCCPIQPPDMSRAAWRPTTCSWRISVEKS